MYIYIYAYIYIGGLAKDNSPVKEVLRNPTQNSKRGKKLQKYKQKVRRQIQDTSLLQRGFCTNMYNHCLLRLLTVGFMWRRSGFNNKPIIVDFVPEQWHRGGFYF